MKNTKKKFYWKVVRILPDTKNEFGSAIIYSGKFSMVYKIGKFTKSPLKKNGIFVFNTRQNARRFKKEIDFYFGTYIVKIFKTEVSGRENKKPISYKILSLEKNRIFKDDRTHWPTGTTTFQEVKLISKE